MPAPQVCAAVAPVTHEYVALSTGKRQPIEVYCTRPLGHPGDHEIDPQVWERRGGWVLQPREFRWA